MIKFLLFMGLFLMLSPLKAAMTPEEANEIAKGLPSKIAKSGNQLKKLGIKTDAMLDAWKVRRALGSKKYDSLTSNEKTRLTKANKTLIPFFDANGNKNDSSFLELQEAIDQEVTLLDKYRDDLNTVDTYIDGHPEEMRKFPNSEKLPALIDDAYNDITNTKIDAVQTTSTLNHIEAEFDKKQIAAYLADKIAQFMNSNSFCRAKNHCANRDSENPVDPDLLYEEVFPDISNELRRIGGQETYDKVHKRKSQAKGNGSPPLKQEDESASTSEQNPK